MYDVLIWNDLSDEFIPERDALGRRVSFYKWVDAAIYASEREVEDGQRRRVRYRTPSRKR